MEDLIINARVSIPGDELEITASRSSGPGGQHVNKSDTRIQVRWNVVTTKAVGDIRRRRLLGAFGNRLTMTGDLVLVCENHRSQRRNRQEALQRLAAMVRTALVPPRPRKKTKPTAASRRRRLEAKHRQGQRKKSRGRVNDTD